MNCSLWSKCIDPNKNFSYICAAHRPLNAEPVASEIILPKKAKLDLASDGLEEKFDHSRDFRQLVDDALANEHGISADLRIDDRDLKRAPNFFIFCTSPEYLKVKPYAKQLEIGINLLQEYCPRCSHRRYVKDIPVDATYDEILEKVVLLEWDHCPKCKVSKAELVLAGELQDYYELAISAGQRGGKSAVTAMLTAYITHLFLKLGNPAEVYNLISGDVLYGTFTALNLEQVTQSLWRPITRYFSRTPWFTKYHEMLAYYGNKYGEEILRFGETFINYRHRGLILNIATPDRRKLRGSTRFLGGIDELGQFDAQNSGQVKYNAEQIYRAMVNSFETLRSEHHALRKRGISFIPPPMFMNISSPTTKFDKITTLTEENRDCEDIIFARHLATWEMNPKITRKRLQVHFNHNYADAMRDYGAVPPMSTNAFFNEILDFKGSVDRNYVNCFKIKSVLKTNSVGKQQTVGKLKFVWRDKTVPKILSFDAGETNNSFALTLGHIEDDYPVIDGMAEIIPSVNHKINYNDIFENIICPIIEEMNVRFVCADRWQSTKIMDDIEANFGIPTEVYSVKYAEFEAFRQAVWDANVTFPFPEMKAKQIEHIDEKSYPQCFADSPISHFIFQAVTVQDYKGKSVEKGTGLTDDIFRSAVVLHAFLNDDEIRAQFMGTIGRSRPENLGVVLTERDVTGGVAASRIGALATGAGMAMSGSGVNVFSRGV